MSKRAKAAPLSAHDVGVLSSAIGDVSCAQTLSRSVKWVRRQRAMMTGGAGGIEVLPVSQTPPQCALEQRRPDTARYARWFYRADWSIKEICWLFDAEAEEMAEVLL